MFIISDKIIGLKIGEIKELVRCYKRLEPLRPNVVKRLNQLQLLYSDGSYRNKLNDIIVNFKDRLWQSEIDYLDSLITNKRHIPTKFMSRLIRLKDTDPKLRILINAIINHYIPNNIKHR